MAGQSDISAKEVDRLYEKLDREARAGGYFLNPDTDDTKGLVNGLLMNDKRYGYLACPCRLASGDKADDLDIICPCDYRDADVTELGACYCSLYVSKAVVEGKAELAPVPERRPSEDERKTQASPGRAAGAQDLSYPVYRCKVCGYLCARDNPPDVCPVCKATKERFERFM